MKKKILVDFQSLKNPYCGLGQLAQYLGKELSHYNDTFDLTYLLPKKAEKLFENVSFETTSFWKKNPFYHFIPQKKYDLWHMTEQNSNFFTFYKKTPIILTIHDLNFLREKSKKKITKRIKKLQKIIDKAQIITTISNFSKQEIEHYLDTSNKEIRVIYNGLNVSEIGEIKPKFAHVEQPFLFTIGQVVAKKNFHVLVDFVKNTPYKLIIAGQNETSYAKSIQEKIDQENLSDKIILAGAISEAEKKWLYMHCSAFLFPSLAEGFGLPVIEAMQYGKPVFLSDKTSLPEVGDKYGFYWSDFSPENMLKVFHEGMEYFQNNPIFKEEIIEHAHKFSWKNAAYEYHKVYKELLGLK